MKIKVRLYSGHIIVSVKNEHAFMDLGLMGKPEAEKLLDELEMASQDLRRYINEKSKTK